MLDVLQSPAGIRRHMAAGAHYYLVEVSDQAIGYLAWECRGSELFLSKLYLLLAYRGRGLGREALDFVSGQGLARGCERLSLTVNRRNAPSIAAYRACGFSVVRAVRIDIGGGFFMDDWRLEKDLRRGAARGKIG